MVKYDADQEIMNTYENLQKVQSQFSPISKYSLIFILIGMSIGLSVFGFDYFEKWQIGIWSFLNFW